MDLKPKFTPFPHEKKFAEKKAACDINLKKFWEEDNDDERDFVSTLREQNNEIQEYWNIRNKRAQEAKNSSSITQNENVRELVQKINKWEDNAAINPHTQDHVKKLFTSRSVVKQSNTHAGHTWNEAYNDHLEQKDWSQHKVRDFFTDYAEDTIKFKGTMRN